MNNYSKLEDQIRSGNYKAAKRLSREERVEFMRYVSTMNSVRALNVAELFMSNFKSNPAL